MLTEAGDRPLFAGLAVLENVYLNIILFINLIFYSYIHLFIGILVLNLLWMTLKHEDLHVP